MPRGTPRSRSMGNAAKVDGAGAFGRASCGRGPFILTWIPTPPTEDSLVTETSRGTSRRASRSHDDRWEMKATVFFDCGWLSKCKLSDQGRLKSPLSLFPFDHHHLPMPQGTICGCSMGNAVRFSVRGALREASRGRGTFTSAWIPTPPTSDGLIDPKPRSTARGTWRTTSTVYKNPWETKSTICRIEEGFGRWIQHGIDPNVHVIVTVGVDLAYSFYETEGMDDLMVLEEVLED
ncbi:hypothetical protein K435DRAFT_805411 [Dendrothele bispora CBS 962.96]|uniref:Uncharacterized protein n=1 Tax=Dendrothele bispora (strain CBS 962.96) TaxID=1314807 RepID=A0A4S8LB57_DENBC|nr:hypothetical protein K435DRAFT_805411 [Dendrothele bispora CBS 962.96]